MESTQIHHAYVMITTNVHDLITVIITLTRLSGPGRCDHLQRSFMVVVGHLRKSHLVSRGHSFRVYDYSTF